MSKSILKEFERWFGQNRDKFTCNKPYIYKDGTKNKVKKYLELRFENIMPEIYVYVSYQHKFEYSYLFGAFSGINGSHFLLEFPFCNTDTFQLFLNEFSAQNPTELKIMVLDNGAFHKSKSLVIPPNIILIFLPPYSPELNPAEKVWWVVKRELVNKTFKTLEQLQEQLTIILNHKLNINSIKSLCSYEYLTCTF